MKEVFQTMENAVKGPGGSRVLPQFGISPPISTADPSPRDFQLDSELRRTLNSLGSFESAQQKITREGVLTSLKERVWKWSVALAVKRGLPPMAKNISVASLSSRSSSSTISFSAEEIPASLAALPARAVKGASGTAGSEQAAAHTAHAQGAAMAIDSLTEEEDAALAPYGGYAAQLLTFGSFHLQAIASRDALEIALHAALEAALRFCSSQCLLSSTPTLFPPDLLTRTWG